MPDTTTIVPQDEKPIVATRPVNLPATGDMLANPALFEHMQRVAKMFMKSALIPEHLKKNDGADAFLALQIARERGESPVAVMQNIYFVSGKAGWLTAYMIGRANKSGVFKGRIKWRTVGKGEEMEVTAYAIAADDGSECSATVSMTMAIGEGWARNAKYKTMQEHMLKWRSATMLIRLYCPEVMHGMQSADELEDMEAAERYRDITGQGSATTAPPEPKRSDFKPPAQQQDPGTTEYTWVLYDDQGIAFDEEIPAAAWLDKLTELMRKAGDDTVRGNLLGANEDVAVELLKRGDLTDEQKAGLRGFYDPPAAEPEADKPVGKDWSIPDSIVGQDARLKAIYDLLAKTETPADVEQLWAAHEAFLEKLGNIKRSAANQKFGERKLTLAQEAGARVTSGADQS